MSADEFTLTSLELYGSFDVAAETNYEADFSTYHPVTFTGVRVLQTAATNGEFQGNDFVSVDTARTYGLSGFAKSGDEFAQRYDQANEQLLGFASYDVDRLQIDPEHVLRFASAVDTTLAAPLNPGDTSIQLVSASGWSNGSGAGSRALAWFGYQDSTGFTYPDFSYTRNVETGDNDGLWAVGGVDAGTNTITLTSPWAGPALSIGAAVRNATDGPAHVAAVLNSEPVDGEFTFHQYADTFGGGTLSNGVSSDTLFRPGTTFIKPVVVSNLHSTPNNLVTWQDIVVQELPSGATAADLAQRVHDLSVVTSDDQSLNLTLPKQLSATRPVPTNEIIKINVDERYHLSAWTPALSEDIGGSDDRYTQHFERPVGFQSFDIDGKLIHPLHVTRFAGSTDTVLRETLTPGATSIFINDATGWSDSIGSTAQSRSFAWFGYTDSQLTTYDDYTYTRNVAFDFDNGLWDNGSIAFDAGAGAWRITLRSAWAGPTVAAGTAVRNATGGDPVQHLSIRTDRPFAQATEYDATIGGGIWQNGQAVERLFRPGTAFIQPTFRIGFEWQDVRLAPEQDVIFDGPITSRFLGENLVSLDQSLQRIEADEPLRIDTSLTYELTVEAVVGDTAGDGTSPAETHTVGFSSYDIDGLEILPIHVTRYDSAVDTTLAAELNAGDTQIVLNDASGWSNLGLSNTRAIAWYNYTDSIGNTYPDFTYTRNVAFDFADGVWDRGAISGNTITLNSPWSGPTLTAGTSVRNAADGTRLNASILDDASVTNWWTTYGGVTAGEWQNGVATPSAFRPGTAFIRAAAEANNSTPSTDDRLTLRKFVIRNSTPTITTNGSDQVVVDLDVLANDELAGSATVEIINVSSPQFGAATILPGAGPNGRDIIRYTSTAWFVGRDELSYSIRNVGTGDEFTTTAHVTITGNSVEQTPAMASTVASQGNVIVGNTRPTAIVRDFRDENYDINAGATLVVNGLAETDLLNNEEDVDNDLLTVRLVAGPSYGTLDLNPDGTFEYTADVGFEGTDTFRYEVTDGLYSEVAAAFIEVHDTPEELLDSRLQEIGVALHGFHEVYQRFTFDGNDSTSVQYFDDDKNPFLSWRVHILPHLGYSELYEQFNLDEPWDSPNNLPLADQMPDVYRAPGDASTSTTTRLQFIGDENETGSFLTRPYGYLAGARFANFADGTSNTALVVESGPDVAVGWTRPLDLDYDPVDPLAPLGDLSSGRINVLRASGERLTLPSTVAPETFASLVTLFGDTNLARCRSANQS